MINGVALLGRIPQRDAAVLSVLIGTTQLVLGTTYLAIVAGNDSRLVLGASGMFLFGLTYIYAGLDVLLRLGSKGLGWFSGLVGALGIYLASEWTRDDPLLGVLWLGWAFLWTLFFLRMVLGYETLAPFTGWALVLTSQVTATIPALMGLNGHWPYDQEVAMATAGAIAALLVIAGALAWIRAVRPRALPHPGRADTAGPGRHGRQLTLRRKYLIPNLEKETNP